MVAAVRSGARLDCQTQSRSRHVGDKSDSGSRKGGRRDSALGRMGWDESSLAESLVVGSSDKLSR